MAAKRIVRLHYPDGKVISEPIERTARENGTDVAGARALIADWVARGDARERPDGGYDVIRYRARRGQ